MEDNIKQDIENSFYDAIESTGDLIDINPYNTIIRVTPEQVTNFSRKNAEVAMINLLAPQLDKVKTYMNNELNAIMKETNQEDYRVEMDNNDMLKIINSMLDDK